jgi:small subunit ribosomal protein S8
MSKNDLISDTFTIIRNAIMAKKESVDVPSSNMIRAILEVLKNENYIETFKAVEDSKQALVRVYLRYLFGKPAIKNIKRVSRPGLRIYVKSEKIPLVLRGKGIAVVSTSKGVVTDKQARESGLGGEVIGYIW